MRKPCPCMYMTVEPEAALKVKILDQSPSETLAFELWKNSFCTGLFSWWISPCQEFYGGPKLISAWPLQLRSLATFNRSVQNISESLLKLHTVTPPKKRKDIQRYMFPKLVSLGIILGPPFSPAGGLSEFSLHLGPREPFGHAVKAAAAFVEAPRLQTCRSGTTPGPRSGCPGRKVQDPGGIFIMGFTFCSCFQKWEESWVVYQNQHPLLSGEVWFN